MSRRPGRGHVYARDIREAAERLGMSASAVARRIYEAGWSREEALTTPAWARRPVEAEPGRRPMRREPERGSRLEPVVEVYDTGRRRRMPPLRHSADPSAGGYTLALVHVDGETEPRWVAAERLDPAAHGPTPERPLPGASPRAPRVL